MGQTFIEYCLAHPEQQPDIDDWVERWHKGDGAGLSLSNYLGLSKAEYEAWVRDPAYLKKILASRKFAKLTQ